MTRAFCGLLTRIPGGFTLRAYAPAVLVPVVCDHAAALGMTTKVMPGYVVVTVTGDDVVQRVTMLRARVDGLGLKAAAKPPCAIIVWQPPLEMAG